MPKLTVYVEGPTDVFYINTAFKVLGRDDLSETVFIDTIGNKIGNQGGGSSNLNNGFAFLKEKRLIEGKILFLADQDVSDKKLPNKGKDFENLYVRRIGEYSAEEKGIEWLFPENIWDEAISKGYAEKTLVTKIDRNGEHPPRRSFQIPDKCKTAFCTWICRERENRQSDFSGFQCIIRMLDEIMNDALC